MYLHIFAYIYTCISKHKNTHRRTENNPGTQIFPNINFILGGSMVWTLYSNMNKWRGLENWVIFIYLYVAVFQEWRLLFQLLK